MKTDVLSLFQCVLPPDFVEQVLREEGIRQNNRIYNARVVMWLMTNQRLQGNASMQTAVLDVVRGLPAEFWPRPCKRLREGQVSGNDASYSTARQELPAGVVERSVDEAFKHLIAHTQGAVPALGQRVFLVDGSSLRTPHREELKKDFPPASNQHGESHWPLVKMLVAHDLQTGLAMRPVWGPMHGPQAVSEQRLFERLVDGLPPGATVLGDINFGVFSVAYAADQRKHPVVLRLQESRARALLGGPLVDGIDREYEWRPSPDDRKSHPELPADACVRGRLLVMEVTPSNGEASFFLALFTTLAASREELQNIYGQRWNVEVDLRTLKSALQLEELTCTSTDMIGKEIDLGMVAYNLVRAVMYAAAEKSGTAPRRYSFTRVRNITNAFLPLIAAAKTPEEAQKLADKMMYYVEQATLRDRRGRRSYARAVWGRPRTFPSRKG